MDYRNIVTFIINNNQYYLYYDLVKDLPIFEELKKSDKLETIEYPGEISYDEINIVLNILTRQSNNYNEITIGSGYKIHSFMKYLLVKQSILNAFVNRIYTADKLEQIVKYMIDNDCIIEFYDMLSCSNIKRVIISKILNQQKDSNMIDIHLTYYLDTFCEGSKRLVTSYTYMYTMLFGIYKFILPDKRKIIGTIWNPYGNNKLVLRVNNKDIGSVDIIHVPDSHITKYTDDNHSSIIKYDIYDIVYNHIKQVLLGQVSL